MPVRYEPKTQEEVLELFRQRKISTQRAAELLGMSHADFTELASRQGIYTSDCIWNPELTDLFFGPAKP
jgi:predicted HTH domain antitoxin